MGARRPSVSSRFNWQHEEQTLLDMYNRMCHAVESCEQLGIPTDMRFLVLKPIFSARSRRYPGAALVDVPRARPCRHTRWTS